MTKTKLTKKELAIIISNATGFSKLFSEQVINDLIKVIIMKLRIMIVFSKILEVLKYYLRMNE